MLEIRKSTFAVSLLVLFLAGFFVGSFTIHFPLYSISGLSVDEQDKDIFFDASNVLVYDDKVILNVSGAIVNKYAGGNSMHPFLNGKMRGISLKPKNAEEIHVGDIVAFRKNGVLYSHRVVEKGEDDEGNYFVTRGDNNTFSDGKIRFEQIESVLIGVIY